MAFTRVLKDILSSRTADSKNRVGHDSSGVALFIVLGAVSVLAILVTEFTYVAQISQSVAFGSLDQVQAHYLAKSAFKLSLLRLMAYQNVKGYVATLGAASAAVPKSMLDQIWSFPFSYPFPSSIPGMSQTGKDAIEKFQKNSGFQGGKFRTNIASESNKYNLNMLLANYAPPAAPIPTPAPGATPTPSPAPVQGSSSAGGTPGYDQNAARIGLTNYLGGILARKLEVDSEFADNRRGFRLEDLIDNISSWVDRNWEPRLTSSSDLKVPLKRAPFYSLSELHMVPLMDDELYDLFAPTLTTSYTTGINVNTMAEPVLRGLIPKITVEEVNDFFKFRDATDVDNKFQSSEDFFAYLKKGVSGFVNNQPEIDKFKATLAKSNIQLITEETQFKITVEAQVNNSYRTIEAWVELSPAGGSKPPPVQNFAAGQPTGPAPNPVTNPGGRNIPDPGVKITFMRII